MSYRVFISYSHDDSAAASSIVSVLKDNGLTVLWDQDFAFGRGFEEQIKSFIAYAHVFLPLITARSSQRGWVHQEIGYALALNVPVLPVAVDVLPSQMLERLHAVRVTEDAARLKADLSEAVIAKLVDAVADPAQALFQCAAQQEERSTMIARFAREVISLGAHGHVRHRGGLSAFDIPAQPVSNSLWRQRYDGMPRSAFQHELLREERLALGEHAKHEGCSLILNIDGTYDRYGPAARRSRLGVLRAFLSEMPDDRVRVAFDPEMAHGDNLLLVGDWFVAAAASGLQGAGYRQTILSRHAPTMRRRVAQFDEELDDLLAQAGTAPTDSRRVAIEAIDRVLASLKGPA